jgi:enolase
MNEYEWDDACIRDVCAREVLDCRGEPTVEVDVITEAGIIGRADVPCGRSRGKHEAVELRDGDDRYHGRGVMRAVRNVNTTIAPLLKGKNASDQRTVDTLMRDLDDSPDKSSLGANAMLGVSLAAARAAAESHGLPLYRYLGGATAHIMPVPVLDMIEGGLLASTDLDFQEHQVMPVGAPTFSEAIRMGMEVYHELGTILERTYGNQARNVGDEGGYTPPGMNDPRDAFDAELAAIEECGYEKEFVLSLDCAASHFYDVDMGTYTFMGKATTREGMIEFYEDLASTYPLASMEDPLYEDDFEGYTMLTEALDVQIVGDDLFATNPRRVQEGIDRHAATALLFKANQIGTVSEAFDVASCAYRGGLAIQVSERSGQTEDTWLADIAVALDAGQIKTGVTRSERTAQYNRLLRIEEGDPLVRYAGRGYRNPFRF